MSVPPNQAPALKPLQGAPLAMLTVAVAFATFMEILDLSIANVAVPNIAGNLGVSSSQGTWVISSYSVASAIMVPLTGWISKRFGEVRTFCLSVTLFVAMSMLCGISTSLPMLVFFRLMQGMVSGPMVPLSQALLLSNYPAERRGMALALWSMTIIVAPIAGPILGGYITDNFSWPWIFYINVPIGLGAGFITWTVLRNRETPTRKLPIDVVGLVLLVLGVGSLQLMLDNGNDLDWFGSPVIIGLTVTAIMALCYFIVWELTEKNPVVELTLFKRRNFRYGVIALSLGFFGFFATTIIFPLWLQTTMGYTATWAGLATAPSGLLAIILMPLVGKNIQRLPLRVVSSFSFLAFGISAFWFGSFNLDASFGQLIWPRIFQGLGVASFFIPINQIILSGLPPDRLAAASGLSNFFRTIAASFATAISVFVWDHRAIYHHAILNEKVNVYSPQATDYLDRAQSLGLSQDSVHALVNQGVSQQAVMLATNDVFWAIGVLCVILIGSIWLTRPPFGTVGPGGGH
jgi:MFS transporter, DHA2 family, multidrug resistance protein